MNSWSARDGDFFLFQFVRPQRAARDARDIEVLGEDVGEDEFLRDGGLPAGAISEELVRDERAKEFELAIVIERLAIARTRESDGDGFAERRARSGRKRN